MKTVVEVTDMKTVQKLANIVRLWYFFWKVFTWFAPTQARQLRLQSMQKGQGWCRKTDVGVGKLECWCRKTEMLVRQ